MMDSMSDAELDGKVDLHKKDDPSVEKRIRRIAAGSGTHPVEVKMLLQAHKQFEGMVSKMGKSGLMGKKGGAQGARQRQMMEQMRKNPNAVMKQLQSNPQAMQMMQQLSQGGGMPGMGGGGGMPGMGGGGGMPDMNTMMQMMGQMGGGGGMPPGMGGAGGGMPDMNQMMQMMGQMGMGGMGGGGRR
mmetsp:Transcript_13329/g.28821  ORF Transcript_13329/g.28821 Transcript_13329/m.28821 type:complete len:186 (-) Transcript_13329:213-770(-)